MDTFQHIKRLSEDGKTTIQAADARVLEEFLNILTGLRVAYFTFNIKNVITKIELDIPDE